MVDACDCVRSHTTKQQGFHQRGLVCPRGLGGASLARDRGLDVAVGGSRSLFVAARVADVARGGARRGGVPGGRRILLPDAGHEGYGGFFAAGGRARGWLVLDLGLGIAIHVSSRENQGRGTTTLCIGNWR